MRYSAGSASGNSRGRGGRRFASVGETPGWTGSLLKGAADMGLTLPEEAPELFLRYAGLLQRWGRRLNLSSRLQPADICSLHILDSLALLVAAPPSPGEKITDLGSGGGFPGIPLAIARPDLRVTLLEPHFKRALFLRTVILEMGIPGAQVVRGRAEEVDVSPADLVVCRAVGQLRTLLPLAERLLRTGGRLAAWKGPGEPAGDLPDGWLLTGRHEVVVPGRATPREILLLHR